MISFLIRITLGLLVLHHLFTPCAGLRSVSGRSNSTGKGLHTGYKDPGKPNTFAGTLAGLPAQNATRRGLGISAWGIIMIIVTFFAAGMGIYYFSICYPILCKKSRKYDIIELTNV